MELQKYFFFDQYALFWTLILYHFPIVKAIVGHNLRQARENEFPFIAAITARNAQYNYTRDTYCAGILISKQDVLTAEHCLFHEVESGIRLIIGSIDLLSDSIYYPAWWISYVQWAQPRQINNRCRFNDVTIIRITNNVAAGISFSEISYINYAVLRNKIVIGAGWGKSNNDTYPRILQVAANLRILPVSECLDKTYRYTGQSFYLDSNFLCSVGNPFAVFMGGDSGGPVIYRNKLVAIHSGIYPAHSGIFNPDKVNLHTTMYYYEDFIHNILLEY